MKNNEEFFNFIEKLVEELETKGEEYTVEAIRSAEEISTVTGEVLGALRLELRKLCDKKIYLHLNSKAEVEQALNYLDKVLGSK
jgi:hypothetical protein